MKIIINSTTYTEIKNLKFAPETDVTGTEAVINDFSADIMSDDDIDVGVNAYLYDDLNNLWAKYWLIEAVRKDKNTISIQAQSILRILDRKTMDAVMYSNTSVSTIISAIFSGLSNEYSLDSSFNNETISGYCPKQSARERLQWICFCMGAYLKTFFADKIYILPVDTSTSAVPFEKTFWKPSVGVGDYVTAVQATAYTYTLGTPQNTDKWVQVGNDYYIQTSQDIVLTNPDVPVTANENVVSVSDVTIINNDNVSSILSLLSAYYFKRGEIDAEIINNREYAPGDKIIIPIDEENYISGYIKSADFIFGLQAKSKIKLIQADKVEGGHLVMDYRYDDATIGMRDFYFPIGYIYSIQNPYIDIIEGGTKYTRTIYMPLQSAATGTITEAEVTDIEDYDKALIYYAKNKVLYMLSVDEVEEVTESGIKIVEVG